MWLMSAILFLFHACTPTSTPSATRCFFVAEATAKHLRQVFSFPN
jgi:hypothetical protein